MNNRLIKILAIAGVSVGLFVIVYISLVGDQDNNSTQQEIAMSTSDDTDLSDTDRPTTQYQGTSSNTNQSSGSSYQDGTYQANQTYLAPGGRTDSIDVGVTLVDQVVTAMDFGYQESNPDSGAFLSLFDSEIRGQVVGKSLNQINLSRVAGASLTTNAFNLALDNIANQAEQN